MSGLGAGLFGFCLELGSVVVLAVILVKVVRLEGSVRALKALLLEFDAEVAAAEDDAWADSPCDAASATSWAHVPPAPPAGAPATMPHAAPLGQEPVMAAASIAQPASFPAVPPAPRPAAAETRGHQRGDEPRPRRSVESWLGRNAIGVVAAVLIFLGLVFLGVAFVPQLSDIAIVAIMFSLSAALTVAGSALSIVRKNGFTAALMGCGAGSLFISVLVTHLHFALIGEVAAYALLLAWMAGCLVLVRRTGSLLLAIVVQIGLALSVCLGYCGGAVENKLALVLVYQAASCVIVVGGNMAFFRRACRSSMFVALALCLVAGVVLACKVGTMWLVVPETVSPAILNMLASPSCAAYATGLVVQVVQATALFGLVAASVARESARADADAWAGLGVQAGMACAVWLATVRVAAGAVVFMAAGSCLALQDAFNGSQAVMLTSAAITLGLACACAVALAKVARRRGLSLAGQPARGVAVALVAGGAVVLMVAQLQQTVLDCLALPLMWAWGLFCLLVCRTTGEGAYRVLALCLVGFDALCLCANGFASFEALLPDAGAVALGFVCTAGLGVLAGFVLRAAHPAPAAIVAYAAACTVLVMAYLSACVPGIETGSRWSISCMACALACVAAGFRLRVGPLRLYGLVVVLACVAKLAFLDVVGLDSLARVAAFVAGGVICFAISALYNFAVKKLA